MGTRWQRCALIGLMAVTGGWGLACDDGEPAGEPTPPTPDAAPPDGGMGGADDMGGMNDIGGTNDMGGMNDMGSDGPVARAHGCAHPIRPRGGRTLGLDLLDVPAGSDFDVNLTRADELGVDFMALHTPWTALEQDGRPIDPDGMFTAIAAVLEAWDLRFSLTIRPIDLTGKTVPADLEGTRFSDPALIERFTAVVDHALSILPPERIVSIQVGNEIDGFDASAEHPDFWSDYGVFLDAVTGHVRATHPGVRVGFTGTFHGMTEGVLHDLGVWTAYAGVVDVVGVTYYPLDAGFGVRAPDVVHDDFSAMVEAFPDRVILLQEVGYPSAAENGSSDMDQARFFCEVFAAWDTHADRIETANVVRLYDVTAAEARDLAGPYGLDTPPFVEYLRSLGIRRADEAAKPGFEVVAAEAAARGFGR